MGEAAEALSKAVADAERFGGSAKGRKGKEEKGKGGEAAGRRRRKEEASAEMRGRMLAAFDACRDHLPPPDLPAGGDAALAKGDAVSAGLYQVTLRCVLDLENGADPVIKDLIMDPRATFEEVMVGVASKLADAMLPLMPSQGTFATPGASPVRNLLRGFSLTAPGGGAREVEVTGEDKYAVFLTRHVASAGVLPIIICKVLLARAN